MPTSVPAPRDVTFLTVNNIRVRATVDEKGWLCVPASVVAKDEQDPDVECCLEQVAKILQTQDELASHVEKCFNNTENTINAVEGRLMMVCTRLQESLQSQTESTDGLGELISNLSKENVALKQQIKEMSTRIQKLETWKTRATPLVNKVDETQRGLASLRKQVEEQAQQES